MKSPLTWVPWYVDSWIYGSSRIELTRAQRSDFLDLVLLSAKDGGFIRANETMAYPPGQLAGMLSIPPADLEETIQRCIEFRKIKRFDSGILYVLGWERYKLTPRHRRRLESGVAEGENTESNQEPNQEPKEEEEERRLENSRGEEIKGERTYGPQNRTSPPSDTPTPYSQSAEAVKKRKYRMGHPGTSEGTHVPSCPTGHVPSCPVVATPDRDPWEDDADKFLAEVAAEDAKRTAELERRKTEGGKP